MKKLLLLASTVLLCAGIYAQQPNIKFTTDVTPGRPIILKFEVSSIPAVIKLKRGPGTTTEITFNTEGWNTIRTYSMGSEIEIFGDNITGFNCSNNSITSLDISNCTHLTEVICSENKLSELDIRNNRKLTQLYCDKNKLSELELNNNTVLQILNCNKNNLSGLDISYNTKLTTLKCNENNLASLNLTKNRLLKSLSCNNNELSNLHLGYNSKLTILECTNNSLTSLNTSACKLLESLKCSNNELTSVNIIYNTELTQFWCDENKLTSLNITNNAYLYDFSCSHNQLELLNIRNNTHLYSLDCSNNQLTTISLSNNPDLSFFYCENNHLSFSDLPLEIRESGFSSTYTYYPQLKINLPSTVGLMVDLNMLATAHYTDSEYVWTTTSGEVLRENFDYTIKHGITSFTNPQTEKVYCSITNNSLPKLTLRTTETSVTISTNINKEQNNNVLVIGERNNIKIIVHEHATVEIYDLSGHKVTSTSISSGTTNLAIDKNGIYIVKVNIQNYNYSRKIIVK